MTAVEHDVPTAPPVPDDSKVDRPLTAACQYLAASNGAWRSATVAREHRCGAVAPPAPLAPEKQRRLCLTADHVSCATFEAARAARPVARDRAPTMPRPLARTTPVVLDHGRLSITMPPLRSDRLSGQAILIVLLCIAFAAIILARLTGGGAPAGDAGLSPTTQATARASQSASPTGPPTSTALATVAATSSAPVGASGSPAAPSSSTTGTRTYKVKLGDTLIGIAAKVGSTPKAIMTLNGITNPSNLKVGQVLQIP